MTIRDRLGLLVEWLRNEPVVCRVLASQALMILASWGIDLSAEETFVVGSVLAAVAARLARRKVTPTRKVPGPRVQYVVKPPTEVGLPQGWTFAENHVRKLVDDAYKAGRNKKSKPQIT